MAEEGKKRLILLTGIPGVGKTTLISKVVYLLRKEGISVGGIYSKERREGRTRVGFVMIDLLTGFQAELASMGGEGPRMGRFRVSLTNLSDFASKAVERALSDSELIVIDEVGPMELMSPEFRRAVKKVLESGKPALMVVHMRMNDPLVEEIKERHDAKMYQVTPENRDTLPTLLLTAIMEMIKS